MIIIKAMYYCGTESKSFCSFCGFLLLEYAVFVAFCYLNMQPLWLFVTIMVFLLKLQIGNECLGCRENVAVFNMSYFGQYYLTGPDAQKAADWIFSNDMNKPPGKRNMTHSKSCGEI